MLSIASCASLGELNVINANPRCLGAVEGNAVLVPELKTKEGKEGATNRPVRDFGAAMPVGGSGPLGCRL
jgi:hypothetical protein